MKLKSLILLGLTLVLASCGSSQPAINDDVTPPKIDNDCSRFVPKGFVLEKQLEGCGFTMATARNGENVCPRVIIIVKDGKLVRISKEIICKSIEFGDEVIFCESISKDRKGAVLEFTMAQGTQDDRFIKIIDDSTLTDVPVSLREGFVPKDFSDINADGYNELIVMDNRWFGLKAFEKKIPPYTHKIAVYRDGKFVDETTRFTSYLEAGTKYWSNQMASAKTELESVNAAVILALIYRDLGKENEGINLMEKIIKTASSKDLVETVKYFLQEYKKKDKNPDWFYPARKPAWEPIPWQQTKTP